jgi:hypothetical protein
MGVSVCVPAWASAGALRMPVAGSLRSTWRVSILAFCILRAAFRLDLPYFDAAAKNLNVMFPARPACRPNPYKLRVFPTVSFRNFSYGAAPTRSTQRPLPSDITGMTANECL